MTSDTIFALSSGELPSGVAIIRLSGRNSMSVVDLLTNGSIIEPRKASLQSLYDQGELLDKGLVLTFPAPNSFTGEDCVEFHLHGGVAVVRKFLDVLSSIEGLRMAQSGEFSRRAFEYGRLDLTEIEGLSDLIAAETEEQRKFANEQASGTFRTILEEWRESLLRSRAFIEAELDFADEDDVPGSVSDQVWVDVRNLSTEIAGHLEGANRGEIIRSGFKIAIMGQPNAGKSSLLNALARRDIAIVSDEEGTTRDVLEANLDISGFRVMLFDTAGIRQTDSAVEAEGIRRAGLIASDADLVIWLGNGFDSDRELAPQGSVYCMSKSDTDDMSDGLSCSVISESGLSELITFIESQLNSVTSHGHISLVGRERHRLELQIAQVHLMASLINKEISFRSEDLRLAGEAIGRITGRIDVEDLLDVIFSEFCVGK